MVAIAAATAISGVDFARIFLTSLLCLPFPRNFSFNTLNVSAELKVSLLKLGCFDVRRKKNVHPNEIEWFHHN